MREEMAKKEKEKMMIEKELSKLMEFTLALEDELNNVLLEKN